MLLEHRESHLQQSLSRNPVFDEREGKEKNERSDSRSRLSGSEETHFLDDLSRLQQSHSRSLQKRNATGAAMLDEAMGGDVDQWKDAVRTLFLKSS